MTAQSFLTDAESGKSSQTRRSEDRHGLINQAYLTVTKRKTTEQSLL